MHWQKTGNLMKIYKSLLNLSVTFSIKLKNYWKDEITIEKGLLTNFKTGISGT